MRGRRRRPGRPRRTRFLEQVVPQILASKAYKHDGLLVITVDEAPSSGEFARLELVLRAAAPSRTAPPPRRLGRGGGAVGALLLSPFVKAGATSQEPYNHFSLLRTIEDLFAVEHLGYAALPAVKPLEPALFSAAKKAETEQARGRSDRRRARGR